MLALSMRHLSVFATATVRVHKTSEAILDTGGCDGRVQIYRKSATPSHRQTIPQLAKPPLAVQKGRVEGPGESF